MHANEPIHLQQRDRIAVVYRICGALAGLVLMAVAFAMEGWDTPGLIPLFVLVTGGGAISYHVLTSVVACPRCGARMVNFRVPSPDSTRKLFVCRHCAASAYLKEGYYWQSDFSG